MQTWPLCAVFGLSRGGGARLQETATVEVKEVSLHLELLHQHQPLHLGSMVSHVIGCSTSGIEGQVAVYC